MRSSSRSPRKRRKRGMTVIIHRQDPPGTARGADRHARVRLPGAAEDQARPRAALRRDRHPGRVHADVHLPVRRRAGRLTRPVPAVPAARHAGHGRAAGQHVRRDRPEHRHSQGDHRPVPVPARLAARPGRRGGPRRRCPLPDRRRAGHRPRPGHGLPPARRRARRAGRDGPAARLRAVPVLGMDRARAGRCAPRRP